MTRPNEFSEPTKAHALRRQGSLCALCGKKIYGHGDSGRSRHEYGEGAHAHHVRKIMDGGSASVDNCVIICQACHYSVHEGGRYKTGSVVGTPSDYEFFHGKP
jgi:5-methylcytosine-specific restriction endonuclease McrA